MSGNGPPHLVRLLHEGLSVEGPGLEDNSHVEEVQECFSVTVELPVFIRESTKVGAVHDSEGSQLTPAKIQLLGTNVPVCGR